MYKHLFKKFLSHHENQVHFSCHSHHFWQDCTRDAMLEYWDDSSRLTDNKWPFIFDNKIPKAQKLIAEILKIDNSSQIVFAPNTHEFVARLFSCFDSKKKIKVLTTDSEFYSFERQALRLVESEDIDVTFVNTEPFATFEKRFIAEASHNNFDLVYFSHVFFNSGKVIKELDKIVGSIKNKETIIVIDGYHGFCSYPTDLSNIQDRIFYLSGGYKYAGAGEGTCFMYVPPHCELRPKNTGWFAELTSLGNERTKQVTYADSGLRFAGATMDYSAMYRLIASLESLKDNNLTVENIKKYIINLQHIFLKILDKNNHSLLNRQNLLVDSLLNHGNFFTFKLANTKITQQLSEALQNHGILTDHRENLLRFGFAIYHNEEDYNILDSAISSITRF